MESVEVLVIGGGFAGLCAAKELRDAGFEVLVLERAPSVGGVWRDNVYPGCACDVPSHLYSYSFAPNPSWTRSYAQQDEIRRYIETCVDRFGLRDAIRLGEGLLRASWSAEHQRWQVQTSARRYSARYLVSAIGAFSKTHVPRLPGTSSFAGPRFHSARWRHDVPLQGKRVAVIGTGASAVQFIPEIAPKVAELAVFQRTPPWVLPRKDRAIGTLERALFRALPMTQRLARLRQYWEHEVRVLALAVHPKIAAMAERRALAHLEAQVADPALRAALTPRYPMGCKRILLSDTYYPALCRPNVRVIPSGVERLDDDGVVATSGERFDADVVIYGTGFAIQSPTARGAILGRDGVDLADVWGASLEAYKGTAIAGFPNLFVLLGPNTGLGHSSMIYMIESQVAYLSGALREARDRGWSAIEVRPEAQAEWNQRIQRRSAGTVWKSGCQSWYLDRNGKNTALWPGFTFEFRARTARFDPAAYTPLASPHRSVT